MSAKFVLPLALAASLWAGATTAATLDFTGTTPQGGGAYAEDGLVFDDVRIVNGRCNSLSGRACMALNDNETSKLSAEDGGTFTLLSFWFQFLGKGTDNTLHVTSDLGGSIEFTRSVYDNNDKGQVFSLAGLDGFTNVSWLTFSASHGGNVRLDDFGVSQVPLPAAAGFLLAGLGGLAVAGRRRK